MLKHHNAMLNLSDCCAKLAAFKAAHSHEYGIKKIGIFGSVARKENKENSDIDIVVHIDDPSWVAFCNLQDALTECFGCNVDVVMMRDSLRTLMKRNIERDAIYV